MTDAVRLITDFPFETLPDLSSAALDRLERLRQIYGFAEMRTAIFEKALAPLAAATHLPLKGEILHVDFFQRDDFFAVLPENLIFVSFRMGNQGTRGVVVFESRLALDLVQATLTRGKVAQPSKSFAGPGVTPLTSAIVEYLVLKIMSCLRQEFSDSPKFALENIFTDVARRSSLFPKDTELLVASFSLTQGFEEFTVRIALPVPEKISEDTPPKTETRQSDFADLVVPLQIHVGGVALAPEDLLGLEAGDIVFFDECDVTTVDLKEESAAWVCLGEDDEETPQKFAVSIKRRDDRLVMKWLGNSI